MTKDKLTDEQKALLQTQTEAEKQYMHAITKAIEPIYGKQVNYLQLMGLGATLTNLLYGTFMNLRQMGMSEQEVMGLCQNLQACTAAGLTELGEADGTVH